MIVAKIDQGDLDERRAAREQAQEEGDRVRGVQRERESDMPTLCGCTNLTMPNGGIDTPRTATRVQEPTRRAKQSPNKTSDEVMEKRR
jgi:hypothetical protein